MAKRVSRGRSPHRAPRRRLRVEVAWSNIIRARADAFVVGHYTGVLPQQAELHLDRALSGTEDESRLVLTDLVRRGAIRGALGDVVFFPWPGHGQVVLAGMGRMGTFREPQLRVLARNLVESLGRLMRRPTIATVLIGSGDGNLDVPTAVKGMLDGAAEALAGDATLDIRRLVIAEFRLDRAYEILQAAREAARAIEESAPITIEVPADVTERGNAGGGVPTRYGYSLILAALAQACHKGRRSRLGTGLTQLLRELPEPPRSAVLEELRKRGGDPNRKRLGLAFKLESRHVVDASEIPDRVSFSHDGRAIRSAAITNLTTVAARDLDVRLAWVDRIVDGLQAPLPADLAKNAPVAYRHLVHPDLAERLASPLPLVLELDRAMARVSWELLDDGLAAKARPLGQQRPIARQLRTTYSAPQARRILQKVPRALVIGDPDGSLAHTREEALAVRDLLASAKIQVELRLGPPDELGLGVQAGILPADLFEILPLLRNGDFDFIHFAGHAVFLPEFPDRSGWQFKNEILTASKLEGVQMPPRLIVANACLSARVSDDIRKRTGPQTGNGGLGTPPPGWETAAAGKRKAAAPPGDSRLVVSLADEFFKRGVEDYIGTAWEVPDQQALLFAQAFYGTLVKGGRSAGSRQRPAGATLGDAMLAARKQLYARFGATGELAAAWGAYQHYGDPTRRPLA